MTNPTEPHLPGRLGAPDRAIKDDPRADPRMLAAMTPFGLGELSAAPPIGAEAPLDQLLAFCNVLEAGNSALFAAVASQRTPVAGVSRATEVIKGPDGDDLTLFIHRPDGAVGPLPGMLHLHGGGMVILEAADPLYGQWRDEVAATGMVVVGVEFRNGGGKLGPHPFPAGLDDCAAALAWVSENRAALGIGKLIVSGESGGGNLTLATALKAKRDGRIAQIDGVFALCPYISGAYATRPAELTSLFENDAYFLDWGTMSVIARAYDPDGENARNPLAWPYHATAADLAGLPPHIISVNELDPLRDEGLAYYRKLVDAGVSVMARTVNGACHAGEVIFGKALPEAMNATIRDIKGFADSL
jgi:acetyl esterase/lipase